jgi:hypothetical protein
VAVHPRTTAIVLDNDNCNVENDDNADNDNAGNDDNADSDNDNVLH